MHIVTYWNIFILQNKKGQHEARPWTNDSKITVIPIQFKYMTKKYNAIVFFRPETEIKTRKYRNITLLDNFFKYCIRSGAWYANMYNGENKTFIKRYYFDPK